MLGGGRQGSAQTGQPKDSGEGPQCDRQRSTHAEKFTEQGFHIEQAERGMGAKPLRGQNHCPPRTRRTRTKLLPLSQKSRQALKLTTHALHEPPAYGEADQKSDEGLFGKKTVSTAGLIRP